PAPQQFRRRRGGAMNNGWRRSPFVLAALFCLMGCGRGGGENSPDAALQKKDVAGKPAAEVNSENAPLRLDPPMMANLKIEPVSEQPIASAVSATGKVGFNEDRMARILAPLAGQVTNLRVKVGDSVAAGDALFYVTSREANAAVTESMENRKDLELAVKT